VTGGQRSAGGSNNVLAGVNAAAAVAAAIAALAAGCADGDAAAAAVAALVSQGFVEAKAAANRGTEGVLKASQQQDLPQQQQDLPQQQQDLPQQQLVPAAKVPATMKLEVDLQQQQQQHSR
jgi:hypothetical protein